MKTNYTFYVILKKNDCLFLYTIRRTTHRVITSIQNMMPTEYTYVPCNLQGVCPKDIYTKWVAILNQYSGGPYIPRITMDSYNNVCITNGGDAKIYMCFDHERENNTLFFVLTHADTIVKVMWCPNLNQWQLDPTSRIYVTAVAFLNEILRCINLV